MATTAWSLSAFCLARWCSSVSIRRVYSSRILGSDLGGAISCSTYCSSRSSTISDVNGVTRPCSLPRATISFSFRFSSTTSSASFFWAHSRRRSEPSGAPSPVILNVRFRGVPPGRP